MHFTKTTAAAAFAIVACVSALPVQKRDDAVIGNPANPLDDLLTNVQGGLRGGLDFLSIPSGSSDKAKARRDDAVIGNPANPLDDLLTNVQGGLRGGLDFLSIPSGSSDKKRDVVGDPANPIDDLLTNVDSGVEGFFDFLGAGQKE